LGSSHCSCFPVAHVGATELVLSPSVRMWTRACLAGCCLSWHSEAILHAARLEPAVHTVGKQRVALVLRGEAFRAGQSNQQYVVEPNYTNVQEANYESQLSQVVRPFEEDGYEVDVFSATYASPYDHIFEKSFGPRLKVYKKLRFLQNTSQATNAAENLNAVRDHAKKTRTTYRFVIFARQDNRFLKNLKGAIMSFKAPDDTVLLYARHDFVSNGTASVEKRCKNADEYGWNIRDRSSLSWWCNDRIQIIPWKHLEAFWQLIAGPTLLEAPKSWIPFDNPRWPYECWEELAPLVGGNGHIDFLDEDVLTVCKARKEHGTKRDLDAHKWRTLNVPDWPDCETESR